MSELILIVIAVYVLYKLYVRNKPAHESYEPSRQSSATSAPNTPVRTTFKRTRSAGDIIMDENNQLFKIKGNNYKIFSYKDLIKYELNEDGQSITSGGLSIGRAVAGNVIMGPAGMIMGGVTGKRKSKDIVTDMHIALTIGGKNKGYYKISFIDKKMKKQSKEYKAQLESARETLATLDIMTSEI
ncbi:hypothetical protein ACTQ5J_02045 [Fundicoccus sp. Sow4_F4]|uniref:hypothetical protein n=1 Tax=Fundicoccus sp. Sow4_F4 TaxID=3438783 RepID=UPI003F924215